MVLLVLLALWDLLVHPDRVEAPDPWVHLDHQGGRVRLDPQARLDRMVPTGYRVRLDLKDHQALLEGLARVDPWDHRDQHPQN